MTKLDELEALEKASRESPWIAQGNAVCGGVDGDYAVAECHGPGLIGQQEDAALIAAARNALPALLRIARLASATSLRCPWEVPVDNSCGRCGACEMRMALEDLECGRVETTTLAR